MKLEQSPAQFQPITLVLESPDDLRDFKSLVTYAIIKAPTGSNADVAATKLRDLLWQIGAMQ